MQLLVTIVDSYHHICSTLLQVAFTLVLIAVSSAQPEYARHLQVGGEEDILSEASNSVQDGQVRVSNGLYSKRSIDKTLAFFVDRLNIMPQAFQGKGLQVYVFTK